MKCNIGYAIALVGMRGVMRRRLAHGLAALLLAVSIGAGAGRKPIRSGSDRTQSTQVKSNEGSTQTSRTVTRKLFQVGAASWYGEQYDGKTTASGESFDMYDFTAAHATLPLGTFVRVTNLSNGKTVIVRVNDRGPFVNGRIIDVSYNAARVLDFLTKGVQRVRLDFEECPRDTARTESRPRFATEDDRDSIAHSSVEGVARVASSRGHS